MFLWSLVIAQFSLSALIVLSARWSPVPWITLFFATPGIALAIWAWATMGFMKIRVHPLPTDATQLLSSGPYAVVRHPMYTGLLWCTAVLLFSEFGWWRLLAWVTLAIVMVTKALRHEEVAMTQRFDQYAEYKRCVPGLIPLGQRGEAF